MNQLVCPTPPSAPLEMPTQVLSQRPAQRASAAAPVPVLARLLTFGGALLLTLAAARQMYATLPLDENLALLGWTGVSLWLVLGLFTVTFGWVALTALSAVAGVCCGRDRKSVV